MTMTKRRANPTVIGLFVVGALVLAFLAVVALAGGNVFKQKERAVMHFRGSIYGLQVGAPVVFRGVRLGQVTAVGVSYDKAREIYSIPVSVEIDRGVIRSRAAKGDDADTPALEVLVQRGLTAKLAMQSILTGQLYVDLDFRPGKATDRVGAVGGRTEIPTVRTPIQDLQAQFETLNVQKLIEDVAAIASSARRALSGPELTDAMADLRAVAASTRRITDKLDRRLDPLLGGTQQALASADRAMKSTDTAMRSADRTLRSAEGAIAQAGGAIGKIDAAAGRIDVAAARVGELAAPQAPLVRSLQSAADELTRSAAALRETADDDGATMQRLQRALKEVSQAARSLRELTDELERDPQALLRGKRREE